MRFNLKKVLGVTAAAAVLATVAPLLSSSPASAAATNNGALTITPTSGAKTTSFSFGFPSTPTCPGDTASGGFYWSTFAIPAAADLAATLKFNASGPVPVSGETRASLISVGDAVIVEQNTNLAPGSGQPAIISGIPAFDFDLFATGELAAGVYRVGVACHKGLSTDANQLVSYWSTTMTIAANYAWQYGAVPAAPTSVSATFGDGSSTVTFTPDATAIPAPSGGSAYTVTATPTGGGSAVTQTGSGSPITVNGLTNGTEYTVTVKATNSVGDSPASTGVTGTPRRGAVGGLTATPLPESVQLDWTAPSGTTPSGYRISITPDGGSPTTETVGVVTTATITSLTAGTEYDFTVTPLHGAGADGTTSSTVSATPLSNELYYQDLTFSVPAGAKRILQACGVNGALAAEGDLDAIAAVGTPVSDEAMPGDSPALAYGGSCAINLGAAELVTSGAGSPFYRATGALSQVSVVNTDNADDGVGVDVSAGDFVLAGSGGSTTISKRYLGFSPVLTASSGGTFTVGSTVVPDDTGIADVNARGFMVTRSLVSATAGDSMGLARVDARVNVKFPIDVEDGSYTARLTISLL